VPRWNNRSLGKRLKKRINLWYTILLTSCPINILRHRWAKDDASPLTVLDKENVMKEWNIWRMQWQLDQSTLRKMNAKYAIFLLWFLHLMWIMEGIYGTWNDTFNKF
jgi:hypothetical protein